MSGICSLHSTDSNDVAASKKNQYSNGFSKRNDDTHCAKRIPNRSISQKDEEEYACHCNSNNRCIRVMKEKTPLKRMNKNGNRKQSYTMVGEEEWEEATHGDMTQENSNEDYSPDYSRNAVLFVSHLPETDLYPNQLFNLFSCFGEVLRVKIMSNDHSKALILFSDSIQASKALVLNGIRFRGENIHVRFSSSSYVDPVGVNTCPSVRDLTEDYYGRILHRFNSLEYAQIPWHMPSKKLHVVGFDPMHTGMKDILSQLFGSCGEVESITILKNMAWIEMDCIDSAVAAVAQLHNSTLFTVPGKRLRVSFATYGNK